MIFKAFSSQILFFLTVSLLQPTNTLSRPLPRVGFREVSAGSQLQPDCLPLPATRSPGAPAPRNYNSRHAAGRAGGHVSARKPWPRPGGEVAAGAASSERSADPAPSGATRRVLPLTGA